MVNINYYFLCNLNVFHLFELKLNIVLSLETTFYVFDTILSISIDRAPTDRFEIWCLVICWTAEFLVASYASIYLFKIGA